MGSPAQQGWPGLRPRGHPRWCDGGQGSTLGSGLSPGLSPWGPGPLRGLCWRGAGQRRPHPPPAPPVTLSLTPSLPFPSSPCPPPASKAAGLTLPSPEPRGQRLVCPWRAWRAERLGRHSRNDARSAGGEVWSALGTERQSASLPPWGGRCVGPMAPACLLGPPCPAASVRQAGHSPGHCPGADGAAHGPARRCRWPPGGPWWTCWPESGRAPPARRTGRGPRGARWSGSRRLWDRAPCAPSARPRRPPPSHSTPAPARGRQVRGRLHAAQPRPWYEGLRSAPRPFPY